MNCFHAKYAFKTHRIIAIKNKWLIIRKNAGTVLCSSLLEMCVQSLWLIPLAVFVLELVMCSPPRNLSLVKFHENCNIKFPTHFLIKLSSVKFLLEIFHVNYKSILARKSKYLNSIRVFPFLISFFCWNETNTKSSTKEDRRKMENYKADNITEKLFRSYWKWVSYHCARNIYIEVFI